MNTRLYKYTQEFLKQQPQAAVGRTINIIKNDGGDLPVGYKAIIIQTPDGAGARWLTRASKKNNPSLGAGKYRCEESEMEFIPATIEEFKLYQEDIADSVAELDEKIKCMEDLGVDQLKETTFTAWKLLTNLEAESDKDKRKALVVNALASFDEKQND